MYCLSSCVLELVRCEGSQLQAPGHDNSHARADQVSYTYEILLLMSAIVCAWKFVYVQGEQ